MIKSIKIFIKEKNSKKWKSIKPDQAQDNIIVSAVPDSFSQNKLYSYMKAPKNIKECLNVCLINHTLTKKLTRQVNDNSKYLCLKNIIFNEFRSFSLLSLGSLLSTV